MEDGLQPTAMPGDATQLEALKKVLGIGLASASVGAGFRAMSGFADMSDRINARKRAIPQPTTISVNVPQAQDDDGNLVRQLPARRLRFKTADKPYIPAGHVAADIVAPDTSAAELVKNTFLGRTEPNIMHKPWFWPAAVGASTLGLWGGHKVLDTATNRVQSRERDEDLDEAKEEYRRALVNQYMPGDLKLKRADHSELGRSLEQLCTLYKNGSFGNAALGTYLALAGTLAGATGVATYNWAKGRSPDERLAKALKQREQLRWITRPPEIYAVARPAPVRVSSGAPEAGPTYAPGSEEDQETVRKYAEYASKEMTRANAIAKLYMP